MVCRAALNTNLIDVRPLEKTFQEWLGCLEERFSVLFHPASRPIAIGTHRVAPAVGRQNADGWLDIDGAGGELDKVPTGS